MIFVWGLLLRLGLLFVDFAWDVHNHISWAKDAYVRGLRGFYETQSSEVFATLYPNYPPAAIFIFTPFYILWKWLFDIFWFLNVNIPAFPSKIIAFVESRTFLAGLMKLPAVFADLGLAWLTPFPVLILFNPAFFQNSALWGQIDSIPIFLSLVAIHLLLQTKRYILSTVLFTLAILVKPTALVYLPIFGLLLFRRFKIIGTLKALVVADLVFWLAFLPFYGDGNIITFQYTTYLNKIMATQSLPYVTNGAFNFWVLITQLKGLQDTSIFLLGLSYRIWGYIITGVLTAWILYRMSTKNIFYTAFLIAFSAFLFLTKMHERYTMLILAPLLMAAAADKTLVRWFLILSATSYLNLYHSWPVPRNDLVLGLLSNPIVYIALSLFNLGVFIYLLRRYRS